MTTDRNEDRIQARWQRREGRRRSERARLQKHGASLRRVYIDAVRKRVEKAKAR